MWSVKHILNKSTPNFGRISNLIEISLVGQAPDQDLGEEIKHFHFSDKPSHMTQNFVTVGAKLWTAEHFLVDPWSTDQADLVW